MVLDQFLDSALLLRNAEAFVHYISFERYFLATLLRRDQIIV